MATLKSVTECKYDLFYPEELHDLRNIIHSILKRLRSLSNHYKKVTNKKNISGSGIKKLVPKI